MGFGDAIRAAMGGPQKTELSRSNALVLMAIGYFQPITRGELSQFLGREVSRDAIALLRGEGFIAAGPRSPTPGAPYAYVTTPGFLAQFGSKALRDLPDIEKLEDAGLLGGTNKRRSSARRWLPSCEECWGYRATKTSLRKTQRNDDGWRSTATASVHGQVPKSNGRRRRQRYQCRGRWFETLSSTRKSAEVVVVYPVSKSRDSSRPTAGLVCFALTCPPKAEVTGSNPVGAAK